MPVSEERVASPLADISETCSRAGNAPLVGPLVAGCVVGVSETESQAMRALSSGLSEVTAHGAWAPKSTLGWKWCCQMARVALGMLPSPLQPFCGSVPAKDSQIRRVEGFPTCQRATGSLFLEICESVKPIFASQCGRLHSRC